jgi:hypothetical protein
VNSPMFNAKLVINVIVISILLTTSCSVLKLGQADSISLHLLEPNDKFEVIWNTLDIGVGSNNRRSNMVGLPGKIVILGTKSDGPQSGSLIALDSLSGNIVWTSPAASEGEIISHGENLYSGNSGIAAIYSYDVQNGKVLWRTILFGGHSVVDLYFADDKIFAYTNDFEFFTLDATGKIINSFSETDRVFLEMNGILYMDDLDAIKAIDSLSNKELWKTKLDNGYIYAPIFDNGTIYIRTGGASASIYSIDQNTGIINWKTSQSILSNLYITEKEIYFISYNSSLIGLDKATGSEVINVKISPSLDANEFSRGYFISGDKTNNLLALCFSDNDQIMGVQILNP